MYCMTNAGGGGGGSSAWAYIGVTYPAGSVCTATNGSTTLNAQGTSGAYVFHVPQPSSTPETWTVSCTDGTKNRSATVPISYQYQCETVALVYSVLPVEYQQVEYLESTNGTGQYINLGTRSYSSTDEHDYTFMVLSDSTGQNAVAGYYNGYMLGRRNYVMSTGVTEVNHTINSTLFNGNVGADAIIELKVNTSSHVLLENDVSLGAVTLSGNNSITYLFGLRYGSGMSWGGHYRIYSYVHKNNSTNEVLMHLYPCYRKADNVAGMYDIVGNTFLTNDGSGTFIVGADV